MFELNEQEMQVLLAKLQKAGSSNQAEAAVAQAEIAQAITTPLRQVLLSGDIVGGIFSPQDFSGNRRVEYPLDLLTPGAESQYYAYCIPNHGRIPHRYVESDQLMVPTYRLGNSIDANLRYIKNANWNVVSRMMEVMEAGFVKKLNDDGWQTILAAAVDRNILINDPNASAGQFTPRLITLMKNFMRRNGGGNSATLNRTKLTDLYCSPEAIDDIRAWNLELVSDAVRSNIYYSTDDSGELMSIYNVRLHDLDELGEGQEYQNYYTTTLSGTMAASDTEIAIGLDLSRDDSFVHPVVETLQVFEDNTLHRRGEFSLYGWMEIGFAVLDSRRTLLASL
jgi:hypothetical protein